MTDDETLNEERLRIEQEKLAVEQGKLQVECDKLDFTREIEDKKLQLERDKAKSTKIGIGIPLWAALATLLGTAIYGSWSLKKTADDQFKQKMLELVIQSGSPDAAKARGKFISKLLGQDVPSDLAKRLENIDPADFTDPEKAKMDHERDVMERKTEFIKLLAEHPQQRASILRDWKTLFGDEWVSELEPASSAHSAPPKGISQRIGQR